MYGKSIDKLTHAISRLSEAQANYEKAHQEYQGGSWGWAGQPLKEKIEEAEKKLEDSLNEIIDIRVKVILEKYGIKKVV